MLEQAKIDELAHKHAVSPAAIAVLAQALERGRGDMAQFSHPDLGGTGQWMRGGMLMIGDMFNDRLKARVAALCIDVADALGEPPGPSPSRPGPSRPGGKDWWPEEFGHPSCVGSQNAMRYAFFASSRRLVIEDNGQVSVFDTGDHVITGAGQQQSQQQSHHQSLTFTTVKGYLNVSELQRLKP